MSSSCLETQAWAWVCSVAQGLCGVGPIGWMNHWAPPLLCTCRPHQTNHFFPGSLGAWAWASWCQAASTHLHGSTAASSRQVTVAEPGAAKPVVILQHFCREHLNLMLLHSLQQILVFNCGLMISPVNISFLLIIKHSCLFQKCIRTIQATLALRKSSMYASAFSEDARTVYLCALKGYFKEKNLMQEFFFN